MSDENYIDLAYRILRKLENGREPYAIAVLPMASALHELARSPTFILAAAEVLLREAGATHLELLYWNRGASECLTMGDKHQAVVVHGGTLHEAYAKMVAARKERAGG